MDAMRTLINTRIKDGTDQMGEQLNKLIGNQRCRRETAPRRPGENFMTAPLPGSSLWPCRGACHRPAGPAADPQHRHAAQRAVQAAQTIAGGDLHQTIEDDGKDEAGAPARSLVAMQTNLRKTIEQIAGSATATGRRCRRLSAITEEASRGLQQQNNEIERPAAVNE
jgi:methyl-accepting chemotaxis protein